MERAQTPRSRGPAPAGPPAPPVTPEQIAARIAIRARVAYAVRLCREAVSLLGEAAGSGAQMLDQPFQRAVRDINVISTHVVFDIDVVLELHGRSQVGLAPNSMLV